MHLCCSNCAKKCVCGPEGNCTRVFFPFEDTCICNSDQIPIKRPVTPEQNEDLFLALKEYQASLSSDGILLFDGQSTHGMSDCLINNIVEKCAAMYTLEDITNTMPVFSLKH